MPFVIRAQGSVRFGRSTTPTSPSYTRPAPSSHVGVNGLVQFIILIHLLRLAEDFVPFHVVTHDDGRVEYHLRPR